LFFTEGAEAPAVEVIANVEVSAKTVATTAFIDFFMMMFLLCKGFKFFDYFERTEITDDFAPLPLTDVGVIVHLKAALRFAAGTEIDIFVDVPVFVRLPLGEVHVAL
jgi:hypothetical protein